MIWSLDKSFKTQSNMSDLDPSLLATLPDGQAVYAVCALVSCSAKTSLIPHLVAAQSQTEAIGKVYLAVSRATKDPRSMLYEWCLLEVVASCDNEVVDL